jgi:monoterpene epsilon-lactone hydrolase
MTGNAVRRTARTGGPGGAEWIGRRAGRKVAGDVAIEPGGPPTVEARIAGIAIRMALKWVWAISPDGPAGLSALRKVVESLGRRPIPRGVRIERVDLGRFSGEWVRAGEVREDLAFLYLHGGGYFFGSRRVFRPLTWRLSAATRRPVLAIDYRLAPEHTLDDAREDAVAAYQALLARGFAPGSITVGGDSAGGHLTLVTLLTLRERGLALPGAAVCLSPWADMAAGAPSRWINRRKDPLVPAAKLAWLGTYYARGRDLADPMLSPVNADYTGLPPLMVIYSGSEVLADDATRVAARARAAGVEVTLQRWEGLMHAFPVFADLIPEGRAAFRHIARFVDRELRVGTDE